MATQRDVRRIALSLPETEETTGRFAFSVRNKAKLKAFVWVWQERVEPKKPRVPRDDVLAVRVADLAEKEFLLSMDETKFFTEPHYNGFPAVLVRLGKVNAAELELLIKEAGSVRRRGPWSRPRPQTTAHRRRAAARLSHACRRPAAHATTDTPDDAQSRIDSTERQQEYQERTCLRPDPVFAFERSSCSSLRPRPA